MKASATLTTFLLLLLTSCNFDEVKKLTGTGNSASSLPVTRVLTDNQGRRLKAEIIGRNLTSITLIRTSDSKQFNLPIAKLSLEDQQFVKDLPLVAAPSTVGSVGSEKRETGPIVFKRAKLEEINAEISEVNAEMRKWPAHTIKHRSLRGEMNDLYYEKDSLEAEIRALAK